MVRPLRVTPIDPRGLVHCAIGEESGSVVETAMNPLKNYSIGLFKSDLFGGISVAALSIPIGVAYAEIAGMPPESGIYTAILALVAYFILGSSSQVIIGTDFATVTLFAATVVAAFGSNHGSAPQFMMLITVMTGTLMFAAGLLKLGFIANFLSKPILLGYLNGVSIMLIDSQLDNLTGLKMEQTGLFRRIFEIFEKAGLIHLPTLLLGIASILFLFLCKHLLRKIPTKIPFQLLLIAITAIAAKIFDFGSLGIAFMPEIQNRYPSLMLPDLNLLVNHFPDIFLASAAVMFVAYSSEIPVVQTFSKKGFDPNKEFYALGLAHLLIGFFGGYPVSGDDSRTAVNVAVGGKTKFVGLIAAFLILLVVLLMPGILTALPLVTIAAIIASAGIGMFERGAGLRLFRSDKNAGLVFAVCVVGVLTLGVYQGILFAIVLSILQLIKRSSRPHESEMVYDKETTLATEYPTDSGPPPDDEILIYRFDSALFFYNASYFAERISRRAESRKDLRLIAIDARPINMIDLTALSVLRDLIRKFNEEDVTVVFAGANESFKSSVTRELESNNLNTDIFYADIHSVFLRQ